MSTSTTLPTEPAQARDTDLAPALRVVQLVRKVIRAIDLDSHRIEHRHGVTTPQLVVLGALRGQGSPSLGELARQVQLSPSTVVGIIDRLEDRALVQRSRDPVDRRRIQLTITEAGRNLLDAGPRSLQAALITRFERLPEADQQCMLAALGQLTDLMHAADIDAAPVLAVGPLDPSPPPER